MSANAIAKKQRQEAGIFDITCGLGHTVAGADLFAHASGVLYWPEQRTLIVADLHLEKGSSYAAKQIFLPPYDTTATLRILSNAINAFEPKRVITLGDSFHDEGAPDRLSVHDAALLRQMMDRAEWIWIAGNHDPVLSGDLGGVFVDEWSCGQLTFRHEPSAAAYGEIAGHLHPSAKVRGRGRSVRARCFVGDQNRLILPAFGAYTGGLNVLDEAYCELFERSQFHAYVLGQHKLFPVQAASCLSD